MNKRDDYLWNQGGVKYAYHSYKNEEALPWVIIGTIFCAVFCVFAPLIPLMWVWYFYYCHKNNEELKKDPEIQKFKREYIKYLDKYNK